MYKYFHQINAFFFCFVFGRYAANFLNFLREFYTFLQSYIRILRAEVKFINLENTLLDILIKEKFVKERQCQNQHCLKFLS
jgi:hypothetical protein